MGQRICFISLTPPFLGRRYGWKIAVGMIIDALERLVVDNKETFTPGNTGLIPFDHGKWQNQRFSGAYVRYIQLKKELKVVGTHECLRLLNSPLSKLSR